MNIFILDQDPAQAAKYHCDKHVVKMILETAQILSTAVCVTKNVNYGYGITHRNHPVSLWTRQTARNWLWVRSLGIGLLQEYTYRYDKSHASTPIIVNAWPEAGGSGFYTPPAQCMPDYFKVAADPALKSVELVPLAEAVQAYRNYYLGAKTNLLSYTRREVPTWVSTMGVGIQK